MQKLFKLLVVAYALMLSACGGAQSDSSGSAQSDENVIKTANGLTLWADELSIGPDDAPATMNVYTTVSCSCCQLIWADKDFCKDASKADELENLKKLCRAPAAGKATCGAMSKIVDDYVSRGDLKIVIKDAALNQIDAFAVAAVRCVDKDVALDTLNALRTSVSRWGAAEDPKAALLQEISLSPEKYEQCLASEELQQDINARLKSVSEDGVRNFPTLEIGEDRLVGPKTTWAVDYFVRKNVEPDFAGYDASNIESLSSQIDQSLVGTQCGRTRSAFMQHPGQSVFALSQDGNVAYIARNFYNGRFTQQNLWSWNLTKLEEIEKRSYGDCTVLRVRCENEERCVNKYYERDGERGLDPKFKSTDIYFENDEKAAAALDMLNFVAANISSRDTEEPHPAIKLSPHIADAMSAGSNGKTGNSKVDALFEALDAAMEEKAREETKQYIPELTRAVKLRDGNRNVDRFSELYLANGNTIHAVWAINDSLTADLIRRGATTDIRDLLQGISRSGVNYEKVVLHGTFAMVDVYGNSTEKEVVTVEYSRQTIDRINWSNFRLQNIYRIADGAKIDPGFSN